MKRARVILVPLLLLAGLPAAAQQDRTRSPIIDMHMHAHHVPLPLQPGSPPPCRPRPCVPEGEATATAEESLRETLEQMDHYNIVKGFLSSAELDIPWQVPDSADTLFVAGFLLFTFAGQICIFSAFHFGEASLVSPFVYTQIVGATFFGYVFFDEFPDLLSWLGTAIIIASGIYIVVRETRRQSVASPRDDQRSNIRS